MRFRNFVFIICCLIPVISYGQEFVYVNTDNLILRDRPEKKYTVLAVLHAPSQLKIENYEDGYKNNKAITTKFYQVSFSYKDEETNRNVLYSGWIEKKYTVKRSSDVKVQGADTTKELSAIVAVLIPYMGDDKHNPNKMNYAEFPFPKYKGGEKHFESTARHIYHSGPRGGCYYLSRSGRKVYVDSKLCK